MNSEDLQQTALAPSPKGPEQAKAKAKKPIQLMRERYGKPSAELNDSVKHHKQILKAVKSSLGKGLKTVPDIAEDTGLDKQEVFWHLVALTKYGEATYTKEDYGYFTYALKED